MSYKDNSYGDMKWYDRRYRMLLFNQKHYQGLARYKIYLYKQHHFRRNTPKYLTEYAFTSLSTIYILLYYNNKEYGDIILFCLQIYCKARTNVKFTTSHQIKIQYYDLQRFNNYLFPHLYSSSDKIFQIYNLRRSSMSSKGIQNDD